MYIYNLYSHVHILRNAKCHTRKSKHKKLNEQIVYEHTDAEVITVYILKHKHVPCTSSQKLFIDFEDTCTKCFHRVAIHKRDTCNRWAKYCTWCRLFVREAAHEVGCLWYSCAYSTWYILQYLVKRFSAFTYELEIKEEDHDDDDADRESRWNTQRFTTITAKLESRARYCNVYACRFACL